MTGPENNVTPPATKHQGPVGTGPGLVDRDIPPPGCDDAPAPNAPDDLLATITQDTEAILDRCAAKVEELERLYECAPAQLYQRARTRLAAARANSATL